MALLFLIFLSVKWVFVLSVLEYNLFRGFPSCVFGKNMVDAFFVQFRFVFPEPYVCYPCVLGRMLKE